MSEQQQTSVERAPLWSVTWGLDIFQSQWIEPELFNAPDVNVFRLTFATEQEAYQFKAEIQRYLGDTLIRLADAQQGPKLLAELRTLFGGPTP